MHSLAANNQTKAAPKQMLDYFIILQTQETKTALHPPSTKSASHMLYPSSVEFSDDFPLQAGGRHCALYYQHNGMSIRNNWNIHARFHQHESGLGGGV